MQVNHRLPLVGHTKDTVEVNPERFGFRVFTAGVAPDLGKRQGFGVNFVAIEGRRD